MSEPTRSQILKEVKEVKEEVRELRREKNWSQINHEEKVFGEDNINNWIKGQLGFGC
tara:strand:- start:338 stop:508 length:171 start_codon:yes stop_codon:yes gene_type:complete